MIELHHGHRDPQDSGDVKQSEIVQLYSKLLVLKGKQYKSARVGQVRDPRVSAVLYVYTRYFLFC